ncbi:phage terminase large subunit [Desulfovibrio sp. ZJ200]|uniref:phage terminase large subunit n=1 Tax=Desulfovibrio sp. ZJ200 TaxID=2709792 RepID=UPI0013ED1696|nr:phage terminase large subunit [Desulfovibrio sp. ZJ200]
MLFARATQAERDEIRRACEADLLTFTAIMFRARMAQPFLINWHHERIADALMAVYRGEIKNLLVTMPPGGTKTELCVIHFMAWCFARSPYCRFLHLSGSGELASLNSATAKEIIELEEYQALWPRAIKRDTRAKNRWNIDVCGRTAGGVYATSTGGQVTGFRAGYIRPGFSGAILIDDPLKADDIWSQAKRDAANRKLTGTIRSRRASSEHTPIILIMQRLHEDDPAGHALAGDFAAEFEHLEIQGIQDEGTPGERSYWEVKDSLASMQALRERDPYTFYAQVQQRPTPPGGAMIRTDWIQQYASPPGTLHTLLFVMDTALKTSERNDYSVLSLWGFDGVSVYLLDVERGKWEAPDLLTVAVAFLARHRPRRPSPLRLRGVLIEDKASGTGLIQSLRRDETLRDMPIIPVQRGTDKVSRVNDVLPFIRAGRLRVPESAPWLAAYLGELAAFSPAMTHKHDDQVDVTCDALNEFLQAGGGVSRGMDLS